MTTHSSTSSPPFKDIAQLVAALRTAIEQGTPNVILQTHTFAGSGIVPDIAHGRHIATVLAQLPSPRGAGTKQVLCSGQDQSIHRARLKALMEFCERYAFAHSAGQYNTSSGYAAHTNFEQAAYNALLEVIERDAFMRFWFAPERGVVLALEGDALPRAHALEEALHNHRVNTGSNLLLVQAPAKAGVPVVFALLTAKDFTQSPALIMGAGAAATLQGAIDKALCELEGNTLNLIARQFRYPLWRDEPLSKNFDTSCGPQEHTQLYHHPQVRAQLKFLDCLLMQKPKGLAEISSGPGNYQELVQLVDAQVIDVTPSMVKELACVVQATITDCYPLVFGFPLPYTFECTQLSVAQELPHPFP